jgi:dienelactone hydrolase
MRRHRFVAPSVAVLAVLALGLAGCTGGGGGGGIPTPTTAPGGGGGGGTGPAPTEQLLRGNGPFATSSTRIIGQSGFGGGQVYYPTAAGRYAAIACAPGFTALWSSIAWIGPRLASHGFVVVGIETLTTADQPAQRGTELNAALRWATSSSSVGSRIDSSRLGVCGHSMGGGGTLEAMRQNPALKLGMPIAPWDTNTNMSGISSPVIIFSGSADTIAPEAAHSDRFYATLSGEKAQVSLAGASHFFPQTPNTTMARYMVAWMQRFLNNDTRYSSFACTGSGAGYTFRSTCPV